METFLHNLDWVLPLRSPIATDISNGFTWLGYLPFYLIFLSLGFWLNDRERFLRLAVVLAVSAVLFAWLKDYWQDPRPDIRYSLDPRVGNSFGRPSGHALTTTMLWFWLAYEVKRRWMWAIAIFVVLGVCFSRLYLGVHDVDDVLTGVTVGIAALMAFCWTMGPHFKAFRDLPVWAHLVVIAAIVPLLWPIWPPPDGPPSYITGDFFLLAGALIGLSIDKRLAAGPETMPFSWLRVFFAAISVYALFQILDLLSVIGKATGANELVWGWVTSTLLGLLITAVAPLVIRIFVKITEKAIRRVQ